MQELEVHIYCCVSFFFYITSFDKSMVIVKINSSSVSKSNSTLVRFAYIMEFYDKRTKVNDVIFNKVARPSFICNCLCELFEFGFSFVQLFYREENQLTICLIFTYKSALVWILWSRSILYGVDPPIRPHINHMEILSGLYYF